MNTEHFKELLTENGLKLSKTRTLDTEIDERTYEALMNYTVEIDD